MSEAETIELSSSADAETQKKAQAQGWIPPERYRGPAERFIDAEEYLRNGETILPIVKAQKRELEEKVGQLTDRTTYLEGIIRKNQETMEALEEYHTAETKRKVSEVRKELKAALKEASESGNHEAVAELTDQMTQLKAAEVEEPPAEKPNGKDAEAQRPDPAFVAAMQAIGWEENSEEWRALAVETAKTLRSEGVKLLGAAFLRAVMKRTDEEFAKEKPSGDKAGGNGRPGGGNGAASGGKRGWNSLPSDAKFSLESFVSRLTGEGKRYKTTDEARAALARNYWEQEA